MKASNGRLELALRWAKFYHQIQVIYFCFAMKRKLVFILLHICVFHQSMQRKLWDIKVHIFWDDHKILRNLHRRFDCYYMGQIYGGDFAKNLWPSQNIWTLSFNIHTYLSIRYQWVATFWHFQVLFLQRMNNTIPWQKCAAFLYFLTSSLVVCT